MRAIIIDDEELNIELVANFCKRYTPYVEIAATATNFEDGIAELVHKKPDLLFLDIEIHNNTGFDILNALNNHDDLMVIMITAHEKYAVDAVRAQVMDYLLKPVIIKDFVRAVERCHKEFEKNKATDGIPEITAAENKYLTIHYREHIEILPIDSILHLESQRSYTLITTMNNQQHLSSKPLSDYEDKLPEHTFLRIHNSHIVNIKGISKLLRSRSGGVFLVNGVEVPVSRNKRLEILERFML